MLWAFSCREIDTNEYWLVEDLSIRCWHGDHSFYTQNLAFPGLILWGLCAPGFVLLLILKNRKRLNEDVMKARFGFLLLGYKQNLYYWEFIIIYRKIFIILISVFLSTVSDSVSALSAFLVLIIAYYIQTLYQPFEVAKLNKLEQLSILTAATTIYCGLYYLTDEITTGLKIFLFVLILISNSVFVVVWFEGLLEAYAILMCDKYPKIAKILCKCFIKSRRFQDFAFQLGIDVRKSNSEVVPDPETNFTNSQITEQDIKGYPHTPENSIFSEFEPSNEQISHNEKITFRSHSRDQSQEDSYKSSNDDI